MILAIANTLISVPNLDAFRPPVEGGLYSWNKNAGIQVGNFENDAIEFDGSEISISDKDTWDYEFNVANDPFSLLGAQTFYSEELSTVAHFDIKIDSARTGITVVWREGGVKVLAFTNFLSDNEKAKVTLVNDGVNVICYKNGVLVDSKSSPISNSSEPTKSFVGKWLQSSGQYVNGLMWNVCINGEMFNINEGSGNTVTGSLGTVGGLEDGEPETFWDEYISTDLSNPVFYSVMTGLPSFGSGRPVLYFNSPDVTLRDYIDSQVYLNADEDWKVKFSEKFLDTGGNFETLIASENSTSRTVWLERNSSTDDANLDLWYDGGSRETISIPNVYDGLEHEITIEKSGLSLIAMDKGVEIVNITLPDLNYNNGAVKTRWGASYSDRSFSGYVWNICVWKNNVIQYDWPCNEGTGLTVFDVSGNGNDGALTDAPVADIWSKWLKYSDNSIIDAPTIEPNPTGDAVLLAALGVTTGDQLTASEWKAKGGGASSFVRGSANSPEDNAVYDPALAGQDLTDMLAWEES